MLPQLWYFFRGEFQVAHLVSGFRYKLSDNTIANLSRHDHCFGKRWKLYYSYTNCERDKDDHWSLATTWEPDMVDSTGGWFHIDLDEITLGHFTVHALPSLPSLCENPD